VNHQDNTDVAAEDARFVESYILPMDLESGGEIITAGSWMIGMKFSDELYQKIIDGDII
jgi:hypothetical protein